MIIYNLYHKITYDQAKIMTSKIYIQSMGEHVLSATLGVGVAPKKSKICYILPCICQLQMIVKYLVNRKLSYFIIQNRHKKKIRKTGIFVDQKYENFTYLIRLIVEELEQLMLFLQGMIQQLQDDDEVDLHSIVDGSLDNYHQI